VVGFESCCRAYSLESFTFTVSRQNLMACFTMQYGLLVEGVFWNAFEDRVQGLWSKLENLSWIVYMVGLIILITVFLSNPFTSPGDTLFFLSLMAIPLMAGFVVGTLSRGKKPFSV